MAIESLPTWAMLGIVALNANRVIVDRIVVVAVVVVSVAVAIVRILRWA